MNNRNLIDPTNFTLHEIEQLFTLSNQIISNPLKYANICKGKILATLFYESSTRTKFSFEAAMLKLGGNLIGFSDANSSSVSKGESLADTIKTVSIYSDIIAVRHPKEGSAKLATLYSSVPLINAGDGGHQHPTQTLTDLYTINTYKGRLSGHTIGICGDLKNGRTVHSLIKALSRYENNNFVLISPNELQIPDYIREDILVKNNINFIEVTNLENNIIELDILYMTRIQQERFSDRDEYSRLKDSYILDVQKLNNAKKDMIIMHPLPRVNEIAIDVDNDLRAIYFKQAECGMFIRMALIIKLLSLDNVGFNKKIDSNNELHTHIFCKNPNCITKYEKFAPQLFKKVNENNDGLRCNYCDTRV